MNRYQITGITERERGEIQREPDRQTDREPRAKQTDRQTEKLTRLSVTPVYRTVQEGLSKVSCREGITKSRHVLFRKLFTPNFRP